MGLTNEKIYRESLNESVDWMLKQIKPDGTIEPVSKGAIAYYKIPWALVLVGKADRAESVIRWILKETFTEHGDLMSDKRQKFHLDYYTYPNTWTALASHLLSLFDISYKLWGHVSTFQDPETGGYCSRRPYDEIEDNLEDANSTAWCSFVGLHLGKVKEAIRAADFLQMVYDIQPDFENYFYHYWYPEKGLVTVKPPEEPDERFIRLSAREEKENFLYILGAIVTFLAKLYLVTKEERHLRLAETYYSFVNRCHPVLYTTESCGKLCFASIHLFYATGNKRYLVAAERFMMSLLKIKETGGFWIRGGAPTISSTAEFCVWRVNLLMLGDNDKYWI